MSISTRKIGNFGKNASHAEAVRFSSFSKLSKSANKTYKASGSARNEIVTSGKNPLEQNPVAFMDHVKKDLLPRLAEVIEENRSEGTSFQMPSPPLERCIEKQVILPGNVINSRNKLNFFTNVGSIMDAVPNGIEVRILWQVSKKDPSNLFSLNFHKGSRLVPGINPFKDFILVVRVSGKGSPENFDDVSNVFIKALSNHRLLRAGAVEVDKRISPYIRMLADIKITNSHKGHHVGRKKAIKFADINTDPVLHSKK